MVVIRYVLALAAALWTIGVVAGVVMEAGKHSGTRGLTELFMGIGAVAVCCYFTVILFRSARRHSSERGCGSSSSSDRDAEQ